MLINSAISRVNSSEPSDVSRVTAMERRAHKAYVRANIEAARTARKGSDRIQSSKPEEGRKVEVRGLFTPERRKGIIDIMKKLRYTD